MIHFPPQALTLTPEQSRLLRYHAPDPASVFMVTAPATWPDDPKLWRLWIVPSSARRVNAAIKKLQVPVVSENWNRW